MKKIILSSALGALLSTSVSATTIGVSLANFDFNFVTSLRQNMQSYADSMDNVTIQIEDAQGDISRQQSQVENFIASGVDGIIVNLVDADFGKSISEVAHTIDMPLVFVNMLPSAMESFPVKQAFVGSDEYEAGFLETTEVCKQLKGKGEAVILMGRLGTTGQRGRTAATLDVLNTEQCNGIKVVDKQTADWMRTPAMDLVTNWISAGIYPDAVIANNDEMALGAVQALKSLGVDMDSVVIAGVDATQEAVTAMEMGDLDVTVYQSAVGQGQGAIQAVLDIVSGKEYEQSVMIPFELVTSDNLANYKSKN
jgi:inositol transport system substrate-binding protein